MKSICLLEKSINLISDAYKGCMYKRLVGYVSRHVLGLIADKVERVKHIGLTMGVVDAF